MMNRSGQEDSANINPLYIVLLGGACWVGTVLIKHWEAVLVLITVVIAIAWSRSGPKGGDEQ